MSAQQIKLRLKEARDALNSWDMKAAINLCREVLKEDKNHYTAHLMIAKAYQETDKATALTYLRRAVELTDDPLIPYLGIAQCVKQSELPPVLYEILKLQPDKYEEYYGKIVECGKKLTDPDPCLTVIQQILEGLTDSESDQLKKKILFMDLSELFLKQKDVPEKWKKLYAESLQRSIKRTHVDQHENYRRCIKYFAELKCNVEVLNVCCEMYETFKKDPYPLEWICKVYTENMKTKEIPNIKEVLKKDICEYVDALYTMNPKSILGLITKGMHHFDSGELFEALDIFTAVNEIKPNWSTCLRMLVQIYQKFRAYALAEKSCRELDVKDINLVRCMIKNGKALKESVGIVDEVLTASSDAEKSELLYLKASAKLLLGQTDIAGELLQLTSLGGDWRFRTEILQKELQGKYSEALDMYSKVEYDLTSDDLVKRGELEYKTKCKSGFMLSFMNALKKDLFNSDAFYWLGKVYFENGDNLRSLKCLEKCLRMNPLNEDALNIFREVCRDNENHDLYREMLEVAVKHGLELGLFSPLKSMAEFYREQDNINEAAIYYRKALRLNPKDYDCWLALGLIQMDNQSFVAAEKIFDKIGQLFPQHRFLAQLKCAIIKTKTDTFARAEEAFDALISTSPASLELFQAYAESHLTRAENLRNQRIFGRSKDHTQKAITLLSRAREIEPNNRNILVLIAKTLSFAGFLPSELSYLELPGVLVSEDHEKAITVLRKENLLVLANKFLERAISDNVETEPANDQLYYLMAENNFYNYNCWWESSENTESNDILEVAVSCIKLAIGLNPNRWEYWNLYGLLLSTSEIGEPGVAEEMFSTALEINKSSFTVWANLGTLYLKCNEVAPANRAFGKAQECEISYENGWLGQAIIADRLGVEDEAMGLYRHCLDLEYHRLAAVGYAKWVTHRLDRVHERKYNFAIENMHAIPMSLDAIGWYMKETDVKASVKSLCYLGYLAYHQGNLNMAANAYLKATERAKDAELDDILFNLGYIYLLLDRPEQAVKTFKHIQSISLDAQIGLAVAHFYAKDYKVTYAIYESALETLAETDEQRIEILTAMAALVYEFQGEEDAKMILMQCVTLSNPIKGLLNICALYLLHNDLQTAALVVKELKSHEHEPEYCVDVAFLVSAFLSKKGDKKLATNYILSMIHKFPAEPKLRTIYVDLIMKDPPANLESRQSCGTLAESILALKHSDLLKRDSEELSKILAMISLTKQNIDTRGQHIYAQKALFVNPSCKAARTALNLC